MKNKFCGIGAVLALSIFLSGCTENLPSDSDTAGMYSNPDSSLNNSDFAVGENSQIGVDSEQSTVAGENDSDMLVINDEVMWALGKTVDELKGRYGNLKGGSDVLGICVFENGYGMYALNEGKTCFVIDGAKVKDVIKGEFTVLNYKELETRAGISYWHIDDEPSPLDECWWAYFTHPDYQGVTFAIYSMTARDEITGDTGIQIRQIEPALWIGPADYNG